MFLSLSRFGIAVLIVRYVGIERFGEYSLILSMLLIAEWLTDFGTTDITVRAICQQPARKIERLNALSAIKGFQIVLGFGSLMVIMLAMQYPGYILKSGAIAGIEIVFYAGILIYRVLFRVNMVMEKDVLAEVLGVLVMIPCIWLACAYKASLEVFVGCYVFSRILFFGIIFTLGRKDYLPAPLNATSNDLKWTIKASLPLGLAGLLVCLYEAIDLILLSKLEDNCAVGYFSSALRFLFPALIIIQAVANTVFPLLSSYWEHHMEKFRNTLQGALNATILISVSMFCLFYNSAEFLMGLLGMGMTEGVTVLRLLSWTVITRSVATILTPLVIITGHQHHALWLIGIALSVKVALLMWLIPIYGLIGGATGYLISEIFAGMIPTILFTQYVVGFKLSWKVAFKAALALSISLLICSLLEIKISLFKGIISTLLFLVFAVFFKVISFTEFQNIIDSIKNRFKCSEG